MFSHPEVREELENDFNYMIADIKYDLYSLAILLYILIADEKKLFLKTLGSADKELSTEDKCNAINYASKKNPDLRILKDLINDQENAGNAAIHFN